MCELLDEPVKSSDSKKRQIEEWQLFCNIDISKNPTRYNVLDVYEGKIELLKDINTNNKTFFKHGKNKRSVTERVEFLTDGQSNLLTEKTGIAKTKIK